MLPPLLHGGADAPPSMTGEGGELLSISGMYERFDDLRDAMTSEPGALKRLDLGEWLDS
jgi:hypothetical protein